MTLEALLLLSVAAASPPAQADSGNSRPALRAQAVAEGEVRLDGRLDEAAWVAAPMADGFVQREPNDGSPASERTEVRVLYSDEAVYVGIRALDSSPGEIRGELARRDQRTQADELVVYLDSYHDRRTAFEFAVNPRGSTRDVYRFNDTDSDASWDPVWAVETAITDSGWVVEMRIPFSQLRYDRAEGTWGLQVYRKIHRKAEEAYWAPYSKEASGFISHFGELTGLDALPRVMRMEVRPYAMASVRRRPASTGPLFAPAEAENMDVGADLKYGLTPDFTLDLTVNPDFGQVEADPAVVNLSAYESFFPEKRPFFVEGSGLFNRFGPAGQLFYSRRIGRPPQGSAAPPAGGTVERPERSSILAAAKVTGKTAGGLGLGIISGFTAEERATLRSASGLVVGQPRVEPLTHHFAGRVEQDFRGGSHRVGTMVTAVNRRLDGGLERLRSAAYVAEMDGEHKWRSNMYALRWQFAATRIEGPAPAITAAQRSPHHYYQRPGSGLEIDTTATSLSGYTLALDGGKEAGTWRLRGRYGRTSPGADINDLGFQFTNAGVQGMYIWAEHLQARGAGPFRSYRLSLATERSWTHSGQPIHFWIRPVLFNATLRNNWRININPVAFSWNPLNPRALRGGPGLREGRWHNSFFGLSSDSRRRVSFDLFGHVGGVPAEDARSWGLYPEIQIRPSGSFNATVGIGYYTQLQTSQWVARFAVADSTRYLIARLDQSTLDLNARVNWTLSPKLSFELVAQPFVSTGAYDAFRQLRDPHARTFEARFPLLARQPACTDGGACSADLDGDGIAESRFRRPDFTSRQLRSTAVLRWEYRSGSVLYVAWQQGRGNFVGEPRRADLAELGEIWGEPADNTVLIKAIYWLAR